MHADSDSEPPAATFDVVGVIVIFAVGPATTVSDAVPLIPPAVAVSVHVQPLCPCMLRLLAQMSWFVG